MHVPRVSLVEPAEIVDAGIEDRRLHDVAHRHPGRLEHCRKVDQRLLGLRLDAFWSSAGGRVYPGHSGAEHPTSCDDRLAVGT